MFFGNYSKPGKGINKPDPNRPITATFFELLPLKLWSLVKSNTLHMLASIPILLIIMIASGILTTPVINRLSAAIADEQASLLLFLIDILFRFIISLIFAVFLGTGPFSGGFVYLLRELGQDRHIWLFSDYFKSIKSNFKQGICLLIIDIAVFMLTAISLNYYLQTKAFFLVWFINICAFIYLMMHMYIYQMMITFDLKLRHILKNALVLTFIELPKNLLLFAILLVIHIVLPLVALFTIKNIAVIVIYILLELLILPSFTGFIVNFFIHPTLNKYVADVNPESDTENK